MKVLQINTVCGTGSTGRIAVDIYKTLEKHGHDCIIAYGRGNAPQGIKSIKIGNDVDKYIHVAETRFLDNHGFASKKATIEFIEKVKEYNPDIIHLHNIHGYYINVQLLFNYLKEANKPVVWTFHDCWPFTGHCAYFDYAGCDKWKSGCKDCTQKNRYPKSFMIDNSDNNYQRKKELFKGIKNMTIVTPSKWLAGLVKESFLKEYEVMTINNGIDLNIFTPKDSNIFRKAYNIEGKFLILGVANVWDERKGLKYFIEISKHIDKNSVIVLVGLNDKQMSQLPQNIIGIKKTNNIEELAEIYSEADVFVNPTLEDNFPTTNLEALACGTPIVTFNTGGSVESVDDSCGVIIPKGDSEQLILTLKGLFNSNISSQKCITKSRLFDKNEKYNEYFDLYQDIID